MPENISQCFTRRYKLQAENVNEEVKLKLCSDCNVDCNDTFGCLQDFVLLIRITNRVRCNEAAGVGFTSVSTMA